MLENLLQKWASLAPRDRRGLGAVLGDLRA